MGILTNLLREKHEQAWEKRRAEIEGFRTILEHSDKKDVQNWAIDSIAKLAGDTAEGKSSGGKIGGGKEDKHGPFKALLKGLVGLNPMAGGPAKTGEMPKRPEGGLMMSPEEQEQQTARKSAVETSGAIAGQRAKFEEEQREEEQAVAARLKRFEAAKEGLTPDEQARTRTEIETGIKVPAPVKPAPAQKLSVAEEERRDAFESHSKKIGKPVEQFTGQDKIDAVRNAKQERTDPSVEEERKLRVTKLKQDIAMNRELSGEGGETSKNKLGQPITSKVDQNAANEYILRTLGITTGGRDKFTSARMRRGQQALMAGTGLSATELAASVMEKRGQYKALNEAITRYRAYEGLENRLVAHGAILKDARRLLGDHGLNLLNKAIQAGQMETGDPNVDRVLIAVNAVSREYATAISNGFQSRAMLPVASSEEASKLISAKLATQQIDAIVDQLEVEVGASKQAMQKQQKDILSDVSKPLARQGAEDTATPPPKSDATVKSKPKTAEEYLNAISK